MPIKNGHIAIRWGEQSFITSSSFWFDETRHEIIFPSNIVGRIRANGEHYQEVCFEASEFGRFLDSVRLENRGRIVIFTKL